MLNSILHRVDWNSSLRPDVTIVAGVSQNAVRFLAHKCVLSDHSGYFKTIFAADRYGKNEDEMMMTMAKFDYLREIRVVNIAAHTFACLLSFMYTGYLELNPVNVYELFLASDLLHISEALELCDRYIKRNQNHVIRPIPRRNISAVPGATAFELTRKLQYQPLRVNNAASPAPSVFKPFRVQTVAAVSSTVDRENEENAATMDNVKGIDAEIKTKQTGATVKRTHLVENNFEKLSETAEAMEEEEGDTVILDVACCDGPIKFRRVANSYYDPTKAISARNNARSCHSCCRSRPKSYRSGGSDCEADDTSSTTSAGSRTRIAVAVGCKRKPKDSNYYQCKTCGCKFPSYYFVHKHHKLHHGEVNSFTE